MKPIFGGSGGKLLSEGLRMRLQQQLEQRRLQEQQQQREQQPQPEAQPQPDPNARQEVMPRGGWSQLEQQRLEQLVLGEPPKDRQRRPGKRQIIDQRQQADRRRMMGFQNELDEADTKEMLGDKFGAYEEAMRGVGPDPRTLLRNAEFIDPNSKRGQEQAARDRAERDAFDQKRREVRQQFGLQGEGADDPLAKFRTDRRNKQVDEKIAKYGSFDKYETETRTENRKKQIQDLINRGDVDAAMAAENQFKDEDTKRDTKRTQIEDFRKRYGLEAPAPVDERERFGTYLDQKRQPKQNFGDLRNLIGGGNMGQPMPGQRPMLQPMSEHHLKPRADQPMPGQRPMPRPMPALPEQPPMQPPMGGSVKQRPGKRLIRHKVPRALDQRLGVPKN